MKFSCLFVTEPLYSRYKSFIRNMLCKYVLSSVDCIPCCGHMYPVYALSYILYGVELLSQIVTLWGSAAAPFYMHISSVRVFDFFTCLSALAMVYLLNFTHPNGVKWYCIVVLFAFSWWLMVLRFSFIKKQNKTKNVILHIKTLEECFCNLIKSPNAFLKKIYFIWKADLQSRGD